MDVNHFLLVLLHSLSTLDFVEKVDFHAEAFILKGKALLKKDRFLQVYFNEKTGTTAFALIENSRRIWGADFDNPRGWHLHTVESPDSHNDTAPKSIQEIIDQMKDAWAKLP